MNNGPENQCFLSVLNAVSRYTFRLFHTLVIFENKKKYAKIAPQINDNWFKNRSRADLGPLILHFGTF